LSLCSGVVVVFWLLPFVATHQSAFGWQSPFLNLAPALLLDSTVSCVGFGCHSCPVQLLVLFDLAIGLAGSKCGFLLDSGPCSCWIGSLVCWTFVGPLFGWFLVESAVVLYKIFFGLGLLDSGSVWFGFAWFIGWILQLSFFPLVWICFPGLECRVATLVKI